LKQTPAEMFLRIFAIENTIGNDNETLLEQYARYLLKDIQAYSIPTDLERLYQKFDLQTFLSKTPEFQGAVDFENKFVIINESDSLNKQNFTKGHELVEILLYEIRKLIEQEELEWQNWDYFDDLIGENKERWCDYGAACILMPMKLFKSQLDKQGISLEVAKQLAEQNRVSLISTLRRMVKTNLKSIAIVVWRLKNKPAELPRANQSTLSGFLYELPKKLRVQNSYTSQNFTASIHPNKSAPDDSTVYKAFGLPYGKIIRKSECLQLEKGDTKTYYVESMRYYGNDTVISLLHE
jgi:Zn-dependent peptidase ImmA (M78 family)